MKESLSSRVGRIASGSVDAPIDAVENAAPELVLEEVIREVDGGIDEVRAEMGKAAATKHLANTRLMEENRRHDELVEAARMRYEVDAEGKQAIDEAENLLAAEQIARQIKLG